MTFVVIDYALNCIRLKLLQQLQDLGIFLHFLFCLLIILCYQVIEAFVILAYIHH